VEYEYWKYASLCTYSTAGADDKHHEALRTTQTNGDIGITELAGLGREYEEDDKEDGHEPDRA
jgi:hypothetical protein